MVMLMVSIAVNWVACVCERGEYLLVCTCVQGLRACMHMAVSGGAGAVDGRVAGLWRGWWLDR